MKYYNLHPLHHLVLNTKFNALSYISLRLGRFEGNIVRNLRMFAGEILYEMMRSSWSCRLETM